jgi:large repetitive protein
MSYTYFDADDDPESASTFRWLRDNVAIDGATDRTYTLVAADEGALISFEVTPVAQSGNSPGLTVRSDNPVGPVTPHPNDPPVASNVLISGTPQVGQQLTGSFTYADVENDLEGASTFRWLRGDTPIDGATAQRYTLGAVDQGALVSFEVTPVAQSGVSPGLAVRSAAVGPVAAPPNAPPVAGRVLISGTAQVGQVLTGSFAYADAENDPQGASTFRWLRNGTPIEGATAPTYTLVAADQEATVSFEVTPVAQRGTSPGLAVRSAAVGPVAAALDDPPVASVVRITGTPQVGQVLMGSYTYNDTEGDPEGVSIFRWLRGGTPIAGATARSYTLVAADQGATVSFEVTPVAQSGTSPGRPIASAAAGPVAPPINLPPTASNVLITGTADIGQVLTGSYTYTDAENDPEGVSIFRWLRDGAPIAGATAETYTLVVADQGAMVSFEVTPVAQTGTSPGLAVVSGPVRSTLGRDRDDGPPSRCNDSQCRVRLTCNGVGTSCTAQVTLFALLPRARLSDRPAARAQRRIPFAASVVNVPPGETRPVRLRVTPRGRRIVRSGTRRILRGILEIRNSPGRIQTTPIRIRIRVRRR